MVTFNCVTGGAGVGKTWFVNNVLKKQYGRNLTCSATTGVAAMQLGGRTLHSIFYLHVKNSINIKLHVPFANNIVIDEASMLRADDADLFLKRLQVKRPNATVWFIGDFLQLPPVWTQMDLNNPQYGGGLLDVLQDKLNVTYLTEVKRQDDLEYSNILNRVRVGENSKEVLEYFNDQCLGEYSGGSDTVVLTPTHSSRNDYVQREAFSLRNEENKTYESNLETEGGSRIEMSDAAKRNITKYGFSPKVFMGQKVMITQNDPNGAFANGTLGTVVELNNHSVGVDTGNGTVYVGYCKKKFPYEYRSVQSWIKYVPLQPSVAWTIHKSQGRTLGKTYVDISGGHMFVPSLAYVMLSRTQRIGDLTLSRPLTPEDVYVSQRALSYDNFLKKLSENG